MPKIGEKEYPYTEEGMEEAKKESMETGIPMSNAMDRVESYQLGGMVKPPTEPSIKAYKKGGKA